MKKNTLYLVSIAIVSLFLAACGTAVAQTPAAEGRVLNVNGSAQVSLAPDIAYIYIGVTTEDANAATAVEQNNTQVTNVINSLKANGIPEQDIQTSNFSIYVTPKYTPEEQPAESTFTVANTVHVTLRDLDQIGELLGTVVQAGSNQINGIQFDVADKTAALAEARKQALENSRGLAEELAEAAGVSLGQIKSINYYGSNYPVAVQFERDMPAMAAGGVPISTGQLSLTVDVNVVYEIR
jgi:uncharacterized protein YggE